MRLHLAKGICLQDLGPIDAAKAEVEGALLAAEETGDETLLARARRALLLMYAWTASVSREHGEKAMALADRSGNMMLAWTAHSGNGPACRTDNRRAGGRDWRRGNGGRSRRTAPVALVAIVDSGAAALQYASGIGDWDAGIATGERTIALAQTFGQRMLLPRLLVWTGLIYLWRGDLERSERSILTGRGISQVPRRAAAFEHSEVQTVVPAHMGLAAYYLETHDFAEAIRVGEAGLAIADRAGYVSWSLQWLLPVVGEAALWSQDFVRREMHCTRSA